MFCCCENEIKSTSFVAYLLKQICKNFFYMSNARIFENSNREQNCSLEATGIEFQMSHDTSHVDSVYSRTSKTRTPKIRLLQK